MDSRTAAITGGRASPTDGVWIGADPGGGRAFGVALFYHECAIRTWCVSSASEAVDALAEAGVREVTGVGVDSPMWWSSGPTGGRLADKWIRTRYGLSGGNVQAANSLRGAALVQSCMFVDVLRQRLSVGGVTETHPKALLRALGLDWRAFCARYEIDCPTLNPHEQDAVISAVAAREGFSGRWSRDLALDRDQLEQDPQQYWLAPMHYFWPE